MHLHFSVCGQVRPMKLRFTNLTKVHMAHQTSHDHFTILLERIFHFIPLTFVVFIHQFVVAPLAMTIFYTGNIIVPHSIKSVPEVTFLDRTPCNPQGGDFLKIRLPPPAAREIMYPILIITETLSK